MASSNSERVQSLLMSGHVRKRTTEVHVSHSKRSLTRAYADSANGIPMTEFSSWLLISSGNLLWSRPGSVATRDCWRSAGLRQRWVVTVLLDLHSWWFSGVDHRGFTGIVGFEIFWVRCSPDRVWTSCFLERVQSSLIGTLLLERLHGSICIWTGHIIFTILLCALATARLSGLSSGTSLSCNNYSILSQQFKSEYLSPQSIKSDHGQQVASILLTACKLEYRPDRSTHENRLLGSSG